MYSPSQFSAGKKIADQDAKIAAYAPSQFTTGKKIAEQDAKIAEQDAKIAAYAQFTAGKKIAKQDAKIAAQDAKIAAQDAKIAELFAKLAQQYIDTKTAKQGALAELDADNRRNASCSAKSTTSPQVVDISNYTRSELTKFDLLLQLDPNYVIAGHTVDETIEIVESKVHDLKVAELRAAVLPPITTWKQLETVAELETGAETRESMENKLPEVHELEVAELRAAVLPPITNWKQLETVAETREIVENKLHELEVAELQAAVLPPITTWKQLHAKLKQQYRDRKTAEQNASRSPVDKSTTLPQVVDIRNWKLSELEKLYDTIKKDRSYILIGLTVDKTIKLLEYKIRTYV